MRQGGRVGRQISNRMAENSELKVRNEPIHKLGPSGSVSNSEVKPRIRPSSKLSGKAGGFLWLQFSK